MRSYHCAVVVFFFNDTATTEIYTLSLHDRSSDLREVEHRGAGGTPSPRDREVRPAAGVAGRPDHPRRPRTRECGAVHRQRSEEHTSELQSRQYLVCRLLLEKKKRK